MKLVTQRLYPALGPAPVAVSDSVLLNRFVAERDESAFELLVHRHGALVFGLCRRLLADAHEAEDALQATFLTLACRASTVRYQQSVGSWLYKVAYRICTRARHKTPRPVLAAPVPPTVDEREPLHSAARQEESQALADEVARLSERLRTVVVLCYLQGKSSSEAAAELGCPVNTISTRLYRAREELKRQLQRRGVGLTGAVAAVLVPGGASAHLAARAASLALQAKQLLQGRELAALASPAVVRLMEGGRTVLWPHAVLLSLVVFAGAAGAWAAAGDGSPPDDPLTAQTESKIPATPQLVGPDPDPFRLVLNPPTESAQAQVVAQLDIDRDGSDDFAVEVTKSQGVLSTYFAHHRLRALSGYKILHGGAPLEAGTALTVADALHAVTLAPLCHVGGSLRYPEQPGRDFSSGPWYARTAALGVARVKDGELQLGYVVLSVSELGVVTVKHFELSTVNADPVEVAFEPQDNDVADVKSKDLKAGGDANQRYLLIEPKGKAPDEGLGLLIVLPGGNGSADFHSFVKRIYKNALPEGQYLLAQPIAKKWTNNQAIVWPTEKNRVPGMKFTTEEFISALIDEIAAQHKVNPQRIFTLSWSSGGPAAYAASFNCPKVTGSFIAMSVFNPQFLPALEKAKGHTYYLYHSEEDRVTPFRMAKSAVEELPKHGATVEMKTYAGGHGWRGNLYQDIRTGIDWLEKHAKKKE